MDLLVTYGFHKEEAEFGRGVKDYYQPMLKDSDAILIKPMESSVSWEDYDDIEKSVAAYSELTDFVEAYSPKILLDIHHSKPRPYGSLDFWNGIEFYSQDNPMVKRFFSKLMPWFVIYDPGLKENPALREYLFKNKSLGGFISKSSDLDLSRPLDNLMKKSQEKGTSRLTLEVMLYGENGAILKDEHYNAMIKKTCELILDLQEVLLPVKRFSIRRVLRRS